MFLVHPGGIARGSKWKSSIVPFNMSSVWPAFTVSGPTLAGVAAWPSLGGVGHTLPFPSE